MTLLEIYFYGLLASAVIIGIIDAINSNNRSGEATVFWIALLAWPISMPLVTYGIIKEKFFPEPETPQSPFDDYPYLGKNEYYNQIIKDVSGGETKSGNAYEEACLLLDWRTTEEVLRRPHDSFVQDILRNVLQEYRADLGIDYDVLISSHPHYTENILILPTATKDLKSELDCVIFGLHIRYIDKSERGE